MWLDAQHESAVFDGRLSEIALNYSLNICFSQYAKKDILEL